MYTIISYAALLMTTAAAELRSCTDYCNALQSNAWAVFRRPECACSFDGDRFSRQKIIHYSKSEQIPNLDDTAIYYAPYGENAYASPSFAEYPFYIVNPAFQKRYSKDDEKNYQVNKINNGNTSNKSTRSTSTIDRKTKNIISQAEIESEEIPFYLDIDINKVHKEDPLSGMNDNLHLSEKDLIECVDLHIAIFSRSSDTNRELLDIWDEHKFKKYESLSDSDLMIEIQNKCQHPAQVLQESLHEITTSRPRKHKPQSKTEEINGTGKTNISKQTEFTVKDMEMKVKPLLESPSSTEFTTESMHAITNYMSANFTEEENYYSDGTQEIRKTNHPHIDQSYRDPTNPVHGSDYTFTRMYPVTSTAATVLLTNSNLLEIPTVSPRLPTDDGILTELLLDKHSTERYVPSTQFEGNTFPETAKALYELITEENTSESINVKLYTQMDWVQHPTTTMHSSTEQAESTETSSTYNYDRTTHDYSSSSKSKNDAIIGTVVNKAINGTQNNNYGSNYVKSISTSDENTFTSTTNASSSLPNNMLTTTTSFLSTVNAKSSNDSTASQSVIQPHILTRDPTKSRNTTQTFGIETTRDNEKKFTASGTDPNISYKDPLTTSLPHEYSSTSYSYIFGERVPNTPIMSGANVVASITSSDTEETGASLRIKYTQSYSNDTNISERDEQLSTSGHIDDEHETSKNESSVGYNNQYVGVLPKFHTGVSRSGHTFNKTDSTQSHTTKSILSDLPHNNYLTTDYMTHDRYTTENAHKLYQTTISETVTVFTNKTEGRLYYPEQELQIPRILTKELYNNSVVSEINGTEDIPNNDFRDGSKLSAKESSAYVLNNTTTGTQSFTLHSDITGTSDIEKYSTTPYESNYVIGKLYLLFGNKHVPAQFVQDSDGQMKLGIDGKSFCNELLDKHYSKSTFLVTLCKCSQSKNCAKAISELT